MAQTITFEFDETFASDLASLGIEYSRSLDDCYSITATVNKWLCPQDVFDILDDNCNAWH